MTITGCNFVGSKEVGVGTGKKFSAVNASTGEAMEPAFWQASESEIDAAARLAEGAFAVMNSQSGRAPGGAGSPEKKAAFLRAIAEELEAIAAAMSERITAFWRRGYRAARNAGELGRTTGQLRLFAKLVEEGWWTEARIEHGDPERKPAGRSRICGGCWWQLGRWRFLGRAIFRRRFRWRAGIRHRRWRRGVPW